jgi:hypothetical protein
MLWVEKNVYRAEHLLIWEDAHGPIPKNHHIHHINGIRDDNRPENLICLTRSQHKSLHQRRAGSYHERISNDALIAAYREAWRRLGYPPKTTECRPSKGLPTWHTFHSRFGSIARVRELAHP